MKYEPLKDKKQKMMKDVLTSTDNNINDKSDFYLGFKKGVNDSFNVFVSFVDLFKRYNNNVKLLMNEHIFDKRRKCANQKNSRMKKKDLIADK